MSPAEKLLWTPDSPRVGLRFGVIVLGFRVIVRVWGYGRFWGSGYFIKVTVTVRG